jgi:putative membrane protein
MELTLLRWLHVSGNLVWIGAILAVGVALAMQPTTDSAVRGRMAYDIYRRLAVPGFVISFLCGAIRLGLDPRLYFKDTHWMHAKLPLALAVIALHHVIGARARRMADGSVQGGGPAGILTAVLGLAALGAAFFAIFKVPG